MKIFISVFFAILLAVFAIRVYDEVMLKQVSKDGSKLQSKNNNVEILNTPRTDKEWEVYLKKDATQKFCLRQARIHHKLEIGNEVQLDRILRKSETFFSFVYTVGIESFSALCITEHNSNIVTRFESVKINH